MKNIAFIITKSEIGGAQTWVNQLAQLFHEECNIILITSECGWLTESKYFKVVEILPGIKKAFSFKTVFLLRDIIKKYQIDSVVASSANAGVYTRLVRLLCDFKCIYVSHGWSCLYNGGRFKFAFSYIEKYLSYLTDVVWCISKGDANKAEEIIGINKNKIVTLSNSIWPLPIRNKLINERKIVFVGRLTHPKRPELIANVVAKRPQYTLDIIGDGEYFSHLKEKYESNDNINFLGEIQGFSEYRSYDVFVLTSDSEGLPMSALEARSAGLPMIISNVGGCFELIDKNGLLVNNNEYEIDQALSCIFKDYDNFYSEALNVRGDYIVENYIDEYRKLILQ